MSNVILDTAGLAEDGIVDGSENSDAADLEAVREPTTDRMSFHIEMKGYTLSDMETMIVEAAARQLIGERRDEFRKAVEAKCMEMVNAKAARILEGITSEIIDKPLTVQFGNETKTVTMREFIGLYGREYLEARVDGYGRSPGHRDYSSYGTQITRGEYIARSYMDSRFKDEIERATSAAITSIRQAVNAKHQATISEEKRRLAAALAEVTATKP